MTMRQPRFNGYGAFQKGEKLISHAGTGQGLDTIIQTLVRVIDPLKNTTHSNFSSGNREKPYFTEEHIRPFFRDEVIDYALGSEKDFRTLDITRGGPRAGIIHPLFVAFIAQTLNAKNEDIVIRYKHDNMEDFPKTLDEFIEYYNTGTIRGKFAIPDFAMSDIKKLTNREGFMAKMLDRRLRKQFINLYGINTKTTKSERKELQDVFYTKERINDELNNMMLRARNQEPVNGDNTNTIKLIQFMINDRIGKGYKPYDAITDINRTSENYDLYIERLNEELPPHQRGSKMDDRIDNIGDDKHGKAKHKMRSLYKAYKIIQEMNTDTNFLTLPAEDMFRLNTLKERYVQRLYDPHYIDFRQVKRGKLETYKQLHSEMRMNSRGFIEEVNDYKSHPETKDFIRNLTPYTPSRAGPDYHVIKRRKSQPKRKRTHDIQEER